MRKKFGSTINNQSMSDQKKQVRYGISDIIVKDHQVPSKYVQVFDEHGKLLGEVEVYIIGYESCEDTQ